MTLTQLADAKETYLGWFPQERRPQAEEEFLQQVRSIRADLGARCVVQSEEEIAARALRQLAEQQTQ